MTLFCLFEDPNVKHHLGLSGKLPTTSHFVSVTRQPFDGEIRWCYLLRPNEASEFVEKLKVRVCPKNRRERSPAFYGNLEGGHDFLNNEILWPRMFEYVWTKPEVVLSLMRGWSTEMGTDEHGREAHPHADVLSPWWQTGHKHHKTKRSADQRCSFASQLDGRLKLARSYRLLADWAERARCGTPSRREEDHSPVGEGNGLIQTWGDFMRFLQQMTRCGGCVKRFGR